jgi:5-methylcytosine-specific restriction endonuclease McrA
MADKRKPWIKFYTRDWRSNAKLRMCSYAARGLWVDLITLMAESPVFGFLLVKNVAPTTRQLMGLLGGTERQIADLLDELGEADVYSMTGGAALPEDVLPLIPADMPGGVIFSRRMLRDKAKADASRKNGPLGGNPDIPRGVMPKEDRSRPFRRSDSPGKTRRIFDMHGGHCHWCGRALLFNPDGGPNGFHVDHVRAICDGGTNDESNLVPSCAACNHSRARLDIVGRARMVPFSIRQQPEIPNVEHRQQPVGATDSNPQSQKPDYESSSSKISTDPPRDAALGGGSAPRGSGSVHERVAELAIVNRRKLLGSV